MLLVNLLMAIFQNLPFVLALLVGVGVGYFSGLTHVVFQVLCAYRTLFVPRVDYETEIKEDKQNKIPSV